MMSSSLPSSLSNNPSPTTTSNVIPAVTAGAATAASKIGKSFIKQYYQTLLTNPSALIRFYRADSTISRGTLPASPAATAGCASIFDVANAAQLLQSTFFDFATTNSNNNNNNNNNSQLRIDFERGAIDAQESAGGGILLVVTGHMYLPQQGDDAGSSQTGLSFVHTFFLDNLKEQGKKKLFYVKNDILRFLGEDKQETSEVQVHADTYTHHNVHVQTTATQTAPFNTNNNNHLNHVGIHIHDGNTFATNNNIIDNSPLITVTETNNNNTAATSSSDIHNLVQQVQVQVQPTELPVMNQFVTTAAGAGAADYQPTSIVAEHTMEIMDNLEEEAVLIPEDEPAAEEQKVDVTDDHVIIHSNNEEEEEDDDALPPDSPDASKGSTDDGIITDGSVNKRGVNTGGKRNRRGKKGGGGKSSRSNSPAETTTTMTGTTENKEDYHAATANDTDTALTNNDYNNSRALVNDANDFVLPREEEEPEKPKTPGSWASLVATGQPKKEDKHKAGAGAGGTGTTTGTGRRASPKTRRVNDANEKQLKQRSANVTLHDKQPPQDRTIAKNNNINTINENTHSSTATPTSSNMRTPEATLFIKNVPDATKEAEIRALFEPIAASSGNKILGITLNPNRGFCFVDFDSITAVDAVVIEADKSLVKEPRTGRKVTSSFMVHGRVLDVERKVKDNSKGYGRRGSRGRSGMRRSPPRNR